MTINGKYGLIDQSGKVLIPCQYENLSDCYKENVLWAWEKDDAENSRIGLIDIHGNALTDMKYNDVQDFEEGVAWAIIQGTYYLIDTTGKQLTNSNFTSVGKFSYDIAWVKNETGKYGLINKNGTELTPIVYKDVANLFGAGLGFQYQNRQVISWVKDNDDNIHWIDNTGKIIVKNSLSIFSINDVIPEALWDF